MWPIISPSWIFSRYISSMVAKVNEKEFSLRGPWFLSEEFTKKKTQKWITFRKLTLKLIMGSLLY